MSDRRSRFRDYIRALDPTGDPAKPFLDNRYVEPLTGVGRRIVSRLDIDPASSHLLVGGIGSGKTTELIRIEEGLRPVSGMHIVRVDVPSRHQLDKLKPGVLLALASLAVAELLAKIELSDKVRKRYIAAYRIAKHHAVGAHVNIDYDGYDLTRGGAAQ